MTDENTHMEVVLDTEQFLHVKLTMEQGQTLFCTLVYAKCDKVARKEIWEVMRNLAELSEAWIIGGNLNTVLSVIEQIEDILDITQSRNLMRLFFIVA